MTKKLTTPPTSPHPVASMTSEERDELLGALATSELIANHRQTKAAAALATRARQIAEIAEIESLRAEHSKSLEQQIRRARDTRDQVVRTLDEVGDQIAGLQLELQSVSLSSAAAIGRLEMALDQSADPAIDDFITKCVAELDQTRAFDPPLVIVKNAILGSEFRSVDPAVSSGLSRRIESLTHAIDAARALKREALAQDDVATALEAIRRSIPPVPKGAVAVVHPLNAQQVGFSH